ncbi:hypothetical protein B0O99DRAFT_736338 [Bisporella sp. PMI_857]|nr:hypothetical protein B0O99DRAFT_736338 [Bisporella sp. PMI_857]
MATLIPTSTSTVLATTAALLAITTPFIPPPSCTPIRDMTSFLTTVDSTWAYQASNNASRYITSISTSWVSVLLSNPSNLGFTACQPSGWASMVPPQGLSFSPAVCPSGWLAHSVRTTSLVKEKSTKIISTAYCCESGYELWRYGTEAILSISPACWETFKATGLEGLVTEWPSITTRRGEFNADTFVMHPAWHITWEKSDTSSLMPVPPSLTSNMLIAIWTPGTPVEKGRYDNYGSGRQETGYPGLSLAIGLAAGIPAAVIAMCCGCCCWACRRSRKKKKKKGRQEMVSNAGRDRATADREPGVIASPHALDYEAQTRDEDLPAYQPGLQDGQIAPPAYVQGPQASPRESAP